METLTEQKCCKSIWTKYTSHRCTAKGIIERDGKFYCKRHDPVSVKEKFDAKMAVSRKLWANENAAKQRDRNIIEVFPTLLEALKSATKELTRVTVIQDGQPNVSHNLMSILNDAIQLAENVDVEK